MFIAVTLLFIVSTLDLVCLFLLLLYLLLFIISNDFQLLLVVKVVLKVKFSHGRLLYALEGAFL